MQEKQQSKLSEISLLNKIIEAYSNGHDDKSIRRILRSEGLNDDNASSEIEAAKKIMADTLEEKEKNKQDNLNKSLAAAFDNLSKNDIVINDKQIAAMEQEIRALLDEERLAICNAKLSAAHSGKLTYREIAFVACVHRLSVTTQNGEAPFKRIKTLAPKYELKIDDRQTRYVLTMLELFGWTKQIECHKQGSYENGKYKKGKAGIWKLMEGFPK